MNRIGDNTHDPKNNIIIQNNITCHKARPSVGPGYPPNEAVIVGVGICSSPIRSNSIYHQICSAARMANTNNTIPTAIQLSLVIAGPYYAGTAGLARRCGTA